MPGKLLDRTELYYININKAAAFGYMAVTPERTPASVGVGEWPLHTSNLDPRSTPFYQPEPDIFIELR